MIRRRASQSLCRKIRGFRGFTLIELVVTVSIIVLLVGLAAYAAVALSERGEVTRTQATLSQLATIVQEWETVSERRVSFGEDTEPFGTEIYEINATGLIGANPASQTVNFTDKLMQILERPQGVKDIVAKIEQKLIKRITTGIPVPPAEGWLRIMDAWGRHILAVHPGRAHIGAGDIYPRDPDGSIRTPYENRFGIAQGGVIYFVSAGPDGEYGDMSAAINSAAFNQTQDNLYSTVPAKP